LTVAEDGKTAITYDVMNSDMKRMCENLGVALGDAITHVERKTGAQNLASEGVSIENIQMHGGWESQKALVMHYLQSMPMQAIRVSGGWPRDGGGFNLPRSSVVPSKALIDAVFPFVPLLREEKKSWSLKGSSVPEVSVDNFFDVLGFLAVVLLQDVAAMWLVLHEPGPHPKASLLSQSPFCDDSLGFFAFKDQVLAAISAAAAAPQGTVQALTQTLGVQFGSVLQGFSSTLGVLGAGVQQQNTRLERLERALLGQGGGGLGVPLLLGGGVVVPLLLGNGVGGPAPPNGAGILLLGNGGINDGLLSGEGPVGAEFKMSDPTTWPMTHVPDFARTYQFDQHPMLQSLYAHYMGTHAGGGPSVKEMESRYGSSSESRGPQMYDWKSGVQRKKMKVERPRAATSAYSKWKVIYEMFDAGTTVAELEAQRIAQFGAVLETPDHLKWLQVKLTKEKPGYDERKARGEKGASTKSNKKAKLHDGGVGKAAESEEDDEGGGGAEGVGGADDEDEDVMGIEGID